MSKLKIISWNVNKVCTKLEKPHVQQLLLDYDVICINEVKTPLPVSLPGYVSFRSKVVGSADRGGTVVCVKNWLSHFVFDIDTSIGDQVWLQFCNVRGVLFGFCYIPPCDSRYYSCDSFSSIQEKLNSRFVPNGYVIIGDMNARFGKSVRELLMLIELPNVDELSYPELHDNINTPNDNAELLSTICIDNSLLVINNLKCQHRHFPGNKTYRRRDTWVSELDTCVASPTLIGHMSDFSVLQRDDLPSDHAPITVTIASVGADLDGLLARATSLGDSAALYGSAGKTSLVRKSLRFNRIDREVFVDNIAQMDPVGGNLEMNEFETGLTDALYSCVQSSVCAGGQRVDRGGVILGRWERLLDDEDDA